MFFSTHMKICGKQQCFKFRQTHSGREAQSSPTVMFRNMPDRTVDDSVLPFKHA